MRVAAANRVAEVAAGITPGMPLADARARLPDLCTAPAEGSEDMAALAALGDWCGRWTPWVSLDAAGPDAVLGASHGLWLDITGCAHLFGGEAALLNDMLCRLVRFGFTARAAMADTPGAAWAVAHYGAARWERAKRGHVIASGQTRAALAKLPLKGLRLSPVEADDLERLGFRAIGDLYGIPRGALARRFGDGVIRRLDQALGRKDEPLLPRRPVTPHRARQNFVEPIVSREAIAAAVHRLLSELAGVLEADGQGARWLELTLYRSDGKVEYINVGTSAPSREPSHLMRLFADPLDALDAGFGFDSVELAAGLSQSLVPTQHALEIKSSAMAYSVIATEGQKFFAPEEGGNEVAQLIDRLGGRLGVANIHHVALFPSHVPERATVSSPAVASKSSALDISGVSTTQLSHWPTAKQRPLLLLPRPEAIEAVAMLPDALPMIFRWRRMVHRVTKAEGPERIAAEWWHAEGAAPLGEETDSIRDYYRVEDDRGRRFWLYRDATYRPCTSPDWWLHGLFG